MTAAEARRVVEALGLDADVDHVVDGAPELSATRLDALKAIFKTAKARSA
jgi:hypothetical protein